MHGARAHTSVIAALRRAPAVWSVATAAAGVAILVTFFAPQWRWPVANLALFGLPAAVCVVVAREGVRLALARALGFRLHGISWGAGAPRFRGRLQGVPHRLALIPLGADTRLASSRPRHHRIARFGLSLAPLVAQGIAVLLLMPSRVSMLESLGAGPAPLAVLHIANLLLIGIHVAIPLGSSIGLVTDLRRATSLLFSGTEGDRSARAVALSLAIERRLECGEVDRAKSQLTDALAQIGRHPLLVELETRLDRIAQAREPRLAAKSLARPDPFDRPELSEDLETRRLARFDRFRIGLLRISPALALSTLVLVMQSDAMLAATHERWIEQAERVALGGDAAACEEHLPVYRGRLTRIRIVTEIPRPSQVRELRARAALHACSGHLDRAVRDQSLAVQIADASRRNAATGLHAYSIERIQAELLYASALRQLAAWHTARGSYRDALRATRQAEQDLDLADRSANSWRASPERDSALALFARERRELEQTRRRILADMDVRG